MNWWDGLEDWRIEALKLNKRPCGLCDQWMKDRLGEIPGEDIEWWGGNGWIRDGAKHRDATVTYRLRPDWQRPEEIEEKPEETIEPYKLGLYKIFWRQGGESLAALYQEASGRQMIAPTNWVHPGVFAEVQKLIAWVERIEPDKEADLRWPNYVCPRCHAINSDDWPLEVGDEIVNGGCQECWESGSEDTNKEEQIEAAEDYLENKLQDIVALRREERRWELFKAFVTEDPAEEYGLLARQADEALAAYYDDEEGAE